MKKPSREKQMSPNYVGEGKPNYKEPKIKYPSYGQYSNQGQVEPAYSMSDRGYTEYR